MQTIVVAGTGRSGTTWIGDVLTSCRSSVGIYEPLRANMVPEVPTNGLPGEHPCAYLRCQDENPQWRHFFRRLLDGSITNCWIRQEWAQESSALPPKILPAGSRRKFTEIGSRFRRYRSKNCIIKEIRANLLLDWLSANFPIRVIYLVRHPCAVVGSRLRLKWNDVLGEILSQSSLVEDFLQPYLPLTSRAKTPLQRMTVHWCIENMVPLAQLPRPSRLDSAELRRMPATARSNLQRSVPKVGPHPFRRHVSPHPYPCEHARFRCRQSTPLASPSHL